MKMRWPAAPPRAEREVAPPHEFHAVAEQHLRKILSDTLADLDVALGLCRPEDTMQNSVLMRAWNRIAGARQGGR